MLCAVCCLLCAVCCLLFAVCFCFLDVTPCGVHTWYLCTSTWYITVVHGTQYAWYLLTWYIGIYSRYYLFVFLFFFHKCMYVEGTHQLNYNITMWSTCVCHTSHYRAHRVISDSKFIFIFCNKCVLPLCYVHPYMNVYCK
jgi:hypothetical protein